MEEGERRSLPGWAGPGSTGTGGSAAGPLSRAGLRPGASGLSGRRWSVAREARPARTPRAWDAPPAAKAQGSTPPPAPTPSAQPARMRLPGLRGRLETFGGRAAQARSKGTSRPVRSAAHAEGAPPCAAHARSGGAPVGVPRREVGGATPIGPAGLRDVRSRKRRGRGRISHSRPHIEPCLGGPVKIVPPGSRSGLCACLGAPPHDPRGPSGGGLPRRRGPSPSQPAPPRCWRAPARP